MQVQVLELSYEGTNVSDIEDQINNYLRHHNVRDVHITELEGDLLVFCFSEE